MKRTRNLYRVSYIVTYYSDDEKRTATSSVDVETWSEDKAREIVRARDGRQATKVHLLVEDV